MFFNWLPSNLRRAGTRRRPERRLRPEPLESRHLLALLPAGPAFVLTESANTADEWAIVGQPLPDGLGNIVAVVERPRLPDLVRGSFEPLRAFELRRWDAAGVPVGEATPLLAFGDDRSSFGLLPLDAGQFVHWGRTCPPDAAPCQYWVQVADPLTGWATEATSAIAPSHRLHRIVPREDGGFRTLSGDGDWSTGDPDLFVRRFDAQGQPGEDETPLLPDSVGAERFLDAIELPGGELLVAWQSPPGETGSALLLGRWNADGTPVGERRRVAEISPDQQAGARLLVEPNGDVAVAWNDGVQIWGQTFSPELEHLGEPLALEPLGPGGNLAELVAAPQGLFVLTSRWPVSGRHLEYIGRYWNPATSSLGPRVELNGTLDSPGTQPLPVWDADGSFVVALRAPYSERGALLRRFLADGTPAGPDVRLHAGSEVHWLNWPPVALPGGSFFLVGRVLQTSEVDTERRTVGQIFGADVARPGVIGYATGDGTPLREADRLSTKLAAIVVEFSHPMQADAGPGSVTRLANWALSTDRSDLSSRIERVDYSFDADSGRGQARLEFVAPLAAGNYELLLSPDVRTAEGLPLDPRLGTPAGGPIRLRFGVDEPTPPPPPETLPLRGSPLATSTAIDPTGQSVVAWVERIGFDPEFVVLAQRVAPDGRPLGEQVSVATGAVAPLTGYGGRVLDPSSARPAVVFTTAGDWVVAWAGQTASAAGADLYVRRFSADGTPLGEPVRAHRTRRGEQLSPALAAGPQGGFVVAWQSDHAGDADVYWQAFDAEGDFLGPLRRANSAVAGIQERPALAIDPDGDMLVAWASRGAPPDQEGIFARRYNADRLPLTGGFRVNQRDFGTQRGPSVASDADGDFVIAFEQAYELNEPGWDPNFPSRLGFSLRRFDAAGRPRGDERFLTFPPLGTDISFGVFPPAPEVTSDGRGRLRVAYQIADIDFEGGFIFDSFVASLTPDLRLIETPRRLNSERGPFAAPSLAMNAQGDLVVASVGSIQASAVLRVEVVPGPPRVRGVWAGEGQGGPLRPGQVLPRPLETLAIELTQDLASEQAWGELVELWHDGVRVSDEQVSVDLERSPAGDRSRLIVHLPRIERGRIELRLRDGLVDRWGAALDGEGNGRPGGDYVLRFSVAPRLPGDVNGDGVRGLADYLVWSVYFGRAGEGLAADLDGDGRVATGDYVAWAAQDPFP